MQAAGAPVGWTKIPAILATWLAAAGLFAGTLRVRGERAAVAAVAVLLFAPATLRYGPTVLGVAEPVACTSLAFWAATAGRWGVAGALLGLGTQWGLHIAVIGLPFLALAAVAGQTRPLLIGACAGTLPLAVELAWYGQPMWDQVFGYHLRKVTHMAAQQVPDRVVPFVSDHLAWLVGALAAACLGARERRTWAWAALAALGLVLAWPRLQSHYFYLTMPLLTAAAVGLWPRNQAGARQHVIAALLLFACAAFSAWPAVARRAGQTQAAAEMRGLAAQVARLAEGKPRPIWGDGALVPLVSLHTGLPVALGDTDLNAQRFSTGLLDPATHVQRVLATRPILVVVPHHGVDTIAAVHDAMLARCPHATPFASAATGYSGVILDCR